MQRHHQAGPCTKSPGSGRSASGHRIHRVGMVIGDLFFLALVGAATTATMHMAHMIEWGGWGFVVEMAIGMAVAMLVQVILAWLAAPLLGSIESMAPSMLLAMIAPMAVCVLHGSGCELTWSAAMWCGAAAGVLASSLLLLYGASCRRWALTAGHSTLGGSHP